MVKEAKGGVFAPSDYPVIKRALHSYLLDIMRTTEATCHDPHPDVAVIANLLHRIGRVDSNEE